MIFLSCQIDVWGFSWKLLMPFGASLVHFQQKVSKGACTVLIEINIKIHQCAIKVFKSKWIKIKRMFWVWMYLHSSLTLAPGGLICCAPGDPAIPWPVFLFNKELKKLAKTPSDVLAPPGPTPFGGSCRNQKVVAWKEIDLQAYRHKFKIYCEIEATKVF